MLLLPCGSFTSPPWSSLLGSLNPSQTASLWNGLLAAVSQPRGPALTHLAVNERIPSSLPSHLTRGAEGGSENILRSPTGLRLLHGDFGPNPERDASAFASAFASALWVTTTQNGIIQTWAPRWTMFSRGNVKEKARLLGFSSAERGQGWAVDLYAGIGYFVFSYVRLGLRVLAWELNPWSVEGLRRGALANGWGVKVVSGRDLDRPTWEVVGTENIVVFLEDNARAAGRIEEIRGEGQEVGVRHISCGFLPSSDKTWRAAWDILVGGLKSDGWLHLHENVGVADIARRRSEIQDMLDGWREKLTEAEAKVEHVELVKTFAPGVWHCVFDVYVTNASGTSPPSRVISH